MSPTTKKGAQQPAKSTKKSEGFTAEEKAAMKAARQRAKGGKADGESALLAAIAAMPDTDRALGKRLHAIIKASARTCRRRPGTGCPHMPRTARSSASSAARTSSRSATRCSASTTAANLDKGSMWPVAFALKELTAADEAKIRALVKKAAELITEPRTRSPRTTRSSTPSATASDFSSAKLRFALVVAQSLSIVAPDGASAYHFPRTHLSPRQSFDPTSCHQRTYRAGGLCTSPGPCRPFSSSYPTARLARARTHVAFQL